MEAFTTALIDRTDWGDGAITLRFERPSGYDFTPGQYAVVRVDTTEGPVGKPFTIASAPADDHLEFTTRLSDSPFKQALSRLVPTDTAEVSSPAGRLSLPEDVGDVVFLVGGVGITPVMSMVRDRVRTGREMPATLFYGNRDLATVPYRAEIDSFARIGVRVVHVIEHPTPEWTGATGFITADLVRSRGVTEARALWLAAGPPVMVTAMERVLDELEVPAEDRLIERFAGYA